MHGRACAWRKALFAVVCATALSAGCHKEGPAERAGKQIDHAADKAADAAKTAGQDMKNAGERMKDAVD
jgi:hypothetical protein